MKKFSKTGILAVLMVLAMLLTACGQTEPAEAPEEPENPGFVTVTDASGEEIQVPADAEKVIICCYGGVTHEMAALGVQDKIIAQPDMQKFPVLAKMNPGFAELPFVGSFDNVNVEEVLAMDPDVVINGVGAKEGNEKLRNAGVTVFEALTGKGNIERVKKEFLNMGKAFGSEEKAEKLISYWEEKLEMIQSRVAGIEDKKEVYYMLGAPTHTNGAGWWGDDFITAAGGINVAAELTESRDTSLEQVINWDPEVIILSENEGKYMPTEEILRDPQLQNIRAIRSGEVYQIPIGAFWWDRPSPESVLGFMWLAKTLYPEEFADLDLRAETFEFYDTFFGCQLTQEEYEAFLNPVR